MKTQDWFSCIWMRVDEWMSCTNSVRHHVESLPPGSFLWWKILNNFCQRCKDSGSFSWALNDVIHRMGVGFLVKCPINVPTSATNIGTTINYKKYFLCSVFYGILQFKFYKQMLYFKCTNSHPSFSLFETLKISLRGDFGWCVNVEWISPNHLPISRHLSGEIIPWFLKTRILCSFTSSMML